MAQAVWFYQSLEIAAFRSYHAIKPGSRQVTTLPAMVRTYCGRHLLAQGHAAAPYSLFGPGHAYCARCAAALVKLPHSDDPESGDRR
jgi:hypothetical protein